MTGKYDALAQHLRNLKADCWPATFADIETTLGFRLPESARRYAAWWANNSQGSRHTSSWLDAGWRTEKVDLAGERLVFRRGPIVVEPGTDETACRLGMTWAEIGSVTVDSAGILVFPAVKRAPAIYRFILKRHDGEAHYIGQTNNLGRRLGEYAKPGPTQHTNKRINAEIRQTIEDGVEVMIAAVMSSAWLEIAGGRLDADLTSESVRLLFENAAILATSANIKILNLAD